MLYKDRLRQELEQRRRKNPRYSLSALARDIGLTPAAVSLILSGRRQMSRRTLTFVGRTLNWNEDEINEALKELKDHAQRAKSARPTLAPRKSPVRVHVSRLDESAFRALETFLKNLEASYLAQETSLQGSAHLTVVIQAFSELNR